MSWSVCTPRYGPFPQQPTQAIVCKCTTHKTQLRHASRTDMTQCCHAAHGNTATVGHLAYSSSHARQQQPRTVLASVPMTYGPPSPKSLLLLCASPSSVLCKSTNSQSRLYSQGTTIAREQPAQPHRQTLSVPHGATAIHFLEHAVSSRTTPYALPRGKQPSSNSRPHY